MSTRQILVLSLLTLTTATTFSPYQRGPHSTTHISFAPADYPGLEEDLGVWVPIDVGIYNVFYFLSSFGGIVPADASSELFDYLASHGVVVIAPWSTDMPVNPVQKVPYLESVMEWVDNNLQLQIQYNGVEMGVVLNLENYVLGAHSAGSHVQVEYLKKNCGKVIGQVWLSPVDGMDPAGLLPVYCITPGTFLNYGTPTLHIAAGLDPVPGASGLSCAPDFLSNQRFYNALNSEIAPKWSINATRFGHADLLNQIYVDLVESTDFCGHNSELTEEDHAIYRRYLGGQIVSFVKALYTIDEEECKSYIAYLEDPSLMTIDVDAEHSNPKGTCPKASCEWFAP